MQDSPPDKQSGSEQTSVATHGGDPWLRWLQHAPVVAAKPEFDGVGARVGALLVVCTLSAGCWAVLALAAHSLLG